MNGFKENIHIYWLNDYKNKEVTQVNPGLKGKGSKLNPDSPEISGFYSSADD